MKRLSLLFVAALGLLTTGLSCGGGGATSCDGTQPCGGDPTGTWKLTSECVATQMGFADECPTATVSASGVTMSGTVSFNADKSYSMDATERATVSVTLPPSCLMQNGITVTCAQLTTILQEQIASGDAPFKTISCTGSSGCTCRGTIEATNSETGTWSSAGTEIMLSTGGGGPYCVKGDEIHLLEVDTTINMGAMGKMKILSDILGKKQ